MNMRPPFRSRARPIPSIRCLNRISGAGRRPGNASRGARLTVLPRGGSPRSVHYRVRVAGSMSRSIGSGKASYSSSVSCRVEAVWPGGGRVAGWNLDVGTEQATPARLGLALLRPVEFAAFDIDGDAHAVLRRVRPRSRVPLAGIDERLDVRTVEVTTHHTHAFPVA